MPFVRLKKFLFIFLFAFAKNFSITNKCLILSNIFLHLLKLSYRFFLYFVNMLFYIDGFFKH